MTSYEDDLSDACFRPGSSQSVRLAYQVGVWDTASRVINGATFGLFSLLMVNIATLPCGELAQTVLIAGSCGTGSSALAIFGFFCVWKRAQRQGLVLDNRGLPKKDRALLGRLGIAVLNRQQSAAKCDGLLPAEPDGFFQQTLWDASELLHRTVRLEKSPS